MCPPCDNEMKSEAIVEHLCASEFGKEERWGHRAAQLLCGPDPAPLPLPARPESGVASSVASGAAGGAASPAGSRSPSPRRVCL